MMTSPEFWSAVAAIGALLTTMVATWHSYRLSGFTTRARRAEHIREIKSLWHQLDITILRADSKVRRLIAKDQFDIDDEDKLLRIYLLFAFLNIAHSLHHYLILGTVVDSEFASAQMQAVVSLLCKDKDLTKSILAVEFGYEQNFIDFINSKMEAHNRRVNQAG
jgi:hypothetical protein